VAGVTSPVSLAQQITLVAGLRWRILVNSLRKKNNYLDLIGMGFASLFGAVLVLLPSLGFYVAGRALVSRPLLHLLVWPFWAVFIFWQIVPIFAAGFGRSFEFRTLLRFPFSITAFYLIGLAYGLADFPALASICWLLALTAGVSLAMPSVAPVVFAVVLLFIIFNVTVERLIGSWLERLLARRRSREVFFALFLLLMFSMQFISPIQKSYVNKANPAAFLGLVKYLAPFPPSLSARMLAGAIHRDFLDFTVGLSGLVFFVAFSSLLLWQRFAAQYRGEELSESADSGRKTAIQSLPSHLGQTHPEFGAEISRSWRNFFGLLSPAVGAMVRKEYFYLVRNGFAFLLLILPPAQILFFSSQFSGKHPVFGGKGVSVDTFFPAMMAYTILVLMGPAYNVFSYEHWGIQTYFMAPVKFRDILLGKNLVTATVLTFEVLLCGGVLAWRLGLPSLPVLFATIAALVFTITGQLPIANWSSLNFPRKLEFGSMRSQRNSGVAIWLMFGVQIVMGGISALILWVARFTGNPWLAAESFAFLASAALGGYFSSLQPLSELAEKKRETLIEALCR
jgi:ABC-2 type transport system permease protein